MKPRKLDEIQVWSVNTHRLWTGYENGKNAALEDCPTDFLEHNEAIEVVKLSDVKLRDAHHQKIIAGLVSALDEVACEEHSDLCNNMKIYNPTYKCYVEIAEEALAAYKSIATPITMSISE